MHAADGERTAAEATLREATALCPTDPAPFLRLARLYLDWNRLQEGLEAVDEARRLGSPPVLVEPLRVALYAGLGDWEQVLAHGGAALTLDPGDIETQRCVAQGYVELGRVEEARAAYRALLERVPDDDSAHERLGALLLLSDPAAALPHLRVAGTGLASDLVAVLAQEGNDPAYRLTLAGQACLLHDEPALAALFLGRAVAHNPAYADARVLLGQSLDRLGRPEEALVHLEEAARLAPRSALAQSLLGLHELEAGDPAAARPHLEAAYELGPDNPAFSLHMAYLWADLGRYDAAEVWLREATRLAPDDPVVWEAAARFALDRGLRQQGLEMALTLAHLVPGSAVSHDLAGWAEFLVGHYPIAARVLEEAVEQDPTLAAAWYHLGQVYAYQGRVEEARAALTRAADLNTDPRLRLEIERALGAIAGGR